MTTRQIMAWGFPGLFFSVSFGFVACTGADSGPDDDCEATTTTTSASGAGGISSAATTTGTGGTGGTGGGSTGSGTGGNISFKHPMDPSQPGQNEPLEIAQRRAAEGPLDERTRLHSCQKLNYAAIGEFLTSRGVDLNAVAPVGQPRSAGELYKGGTETLGVANYDKRLGEGYFYTIPSATKLFDIFVQAAPQIIANIENADACKINGIGQPMFDASTGNCSYLAFTCIMGRPARDDEMELCNLMIAQAKPNDPNDMANKRAIAVAVFLSSSHTCE